MARHYMLKILLASFNTLELHNLIKSGLFGFNTPQQDNTTVDRNSFVFLDCSMHPTTTIMGISWLCLRKMNCLALVWSELFHWCKNYFLEGSRCIYSINYQVTFYLYGVILMGCIRIWWFRCCWICRAGAAGDYLSTSWSCRQGPAAATTLRTSSPSACAWSPSTTTRPASRSSRDLWVMFWSVCGWCLC